MTRRIPPYVALLPVLAGVFIAADDQTVVVTVLPQMMLDLDINVVQDVDRASWTITGYLLGYVAAMPLIGRISDIWGHRRVFVWSMVMFMVGSAAVASVTATRGQGYPVRTPVISLLEIGAGGGSIANVDPGGALTVGPQSAGADPGPACYAKDGDEPTLTDANLVLGRINPDFFLGGEARLDTGLAEKAVREKVADPMGLDLSEAADSIIEIANAKMTSALYFITVQQGIDPR